jgi:hypothetical protein
VPRSALYPLAREYEFTDSKGTRGTKTKLKLNQKKKKNGKTEKRKNEKRKTKNGKHNEASIPGTGRSGVVLMPTLLPMV